VTLALVPFAADQPTSLRLAEAALRARLAPGEELRDLFPPLDASIRSSHATGGLVRSSGEARGIVLWEPSGPLGVALRLLYLAPPHASVVDYGAAFDLAARTAGPIAFAPGPLAGLSLQEEQVVFGSRGFAPFGRSELSLPAGSPVPAVPTPPGAEVRSIRRDDAAELARLHEAAYRHHLDRYLALEELDPFRDAERQVEEYFSGRWGELVSAGSTLVTAFGRPVAAVVAVRRPAHALIIDVMADPESQGRGYGRLALAASLSALRDHGDSAIVLNVTEGNERALRLYRGLGFVRSMGPSVEWYDARRMSVEVPGPDPVRRRSAPSVPSAGSRDAAAPGTPPR